MAQGILTKLDVLKKFEKKTLRKYDMTDSRTLGKVQLSPFVKTPLTFSFKLNYHCSKGARLVSIPFTQPVREDDVSSVPSTESVCSSKSVSSAQITQKNHFDKPPVRSYSATINLKQKPSDHKGKLQSLGNGFMILKRKQKRKPAHSTTEVQKRPERVSEDASRFQRKTDADYGDLPAGTSGWDGRTTVTVEKGDETSQPTTEVRNKVGQYLGKDTSVGFGRHDTRKYTLPEDGLTNEKERIMRSTIQAKDTALKEKKSLIPLCIEDELEKPDAKIIRVDRTSAQQLRPTTVSDSHPIFCNNKGYMEKYVLNRWLALYGDKAFYEACNRGEIYKHLNPVLENNYKESLAILAHTKHVPANITTKRKKMPTFSWKKERVSIRFVSVGKEHYIPTRSQEGRPLVQKTGRSFPKMIGRHILAERNALQTIPKCRKDVFMVYGVNPNGNICHNGLSTSITEEIKSQFPDVLGKSMEESHKKGRLIYVDYIPISKPIIITAYESELLGLDSSHSTHNDSAILCDCTDIRPLEGESSDVCQYAPDKKPFLDEGRLGGLEFSVSRHHSPVQEGSERSIRPASSLSLRSFPEEIDSSRSSSKAETMAIGAEEEHVILPHSPVISIPTAQYEASEPNRDQSMQKTTNT